MSGKDGHTAHDRRTQDRRARDGAARFGGTATLVFVLAGMASHPLPGSIDSLIRGLLFGAPAGIAVGLAAFLVLRARARGNIGSAGDGGS